MARIIQGVRTPKNPFPAKRKVKKGMDETDLEIDVVNDIELVCEWTDSRFVQKPTISPDSNGGIRVIGTLYGNEGGVADISVWVHPDDMEYQLRVGHWYDEAGYDLQDMLLEAWGPYYETFGKSKNSVRKPRTSTSKRKVKKYSESDLDTLDEIWRELMRVLLKFSVTDTEKRFDSNYWAILGTLEDLGSDLYGVRTALEIEQANMSDETNKSKKSKKSKVRKNTLDFEDPEVEFLLNGERIESDEDLKTKIRAGLDADIESGANGIKAYLEAEGELGDWEDSNNRDYILDSISRQIHSAVSYYLYEGEEDEYPEFGMTFTPTIKSKTKKSTNDIKYSETIDFEQDLNDVLDAFTAKGYDPGWEMDDYDAVEYYSKYSVGGEIDGQTYHVDIIYDSDTGEKSYSAGVFRIVDEIYGTKQHTLEIFDDINESIDYITKLLNESVPFEYEASVEDNVTDVQAPQDDLTDIEKTITSKRMKDGSMGDLEKLANRGPLVGQFQPYANNYRTVTMGRNTMSPLPPKMKRI